MSACDLPLVDYYSSAACRAREGEIILLKAALAGRDINLRNSKAELTEAQSSLKEKDSDLEASAVLIGLPLKYLILTTSLLAQHLSSLSI